MNNTSRSGNLMAIINGLIVAVFLILVAASVAVVGSMIVLGRKRPSATTEVIDIDSEIANRSNLEGAFSNWRRERGVTEDD
jgi:hypothetical protein